MYDLSHASGFKGCTCWQLAITTRAGIIVSSLYSVFGTELLRMNWTKLSFLSRARIRLVRKLDWSARYAYSGLCYNASLYHIRANLCKSPAVLWYPPRACIRARLFNTKVLHMLIQIKVVISIVFVGRLSLSTTHQREGLSRD